MQEFRVSFVSIWMRLNNDRSIMYSVKYESDKKFKFLQVKVQFRNPGSEKDCEVALTGDNESWYHLKCKISGQHVKEKLDKELKIVIREQTVSSATIEVYFEQS